ncbi:MAG: ABC transporter ATP-binding protein/permease [Defluviitaleaceae bacterium]|nr:ABC transporter ATP-binding protein/permease [Defluviitaleaceae bacterium]
MKNGRKYSTLKLIWRACLQYTKTSKTWGMLEQSIAIADALSLTFIIIATQILFDVITQASEGAFNFWQVATPLGMLAILTIIEQILSGAEGFLFGEVSYKNMGQYMEEFQLKLSRLPAKEFENTDFLDRVNRAKGFIEYEDLGHFTFVCFRMFTYYMVFFVSIGAYLFWLSPMLPLIILIAFIPSILGQMMQVKIFEKLEEENAPVRRQNDYYQKTIIDREYFKETRLLGSFHFFYRLFSETLLMVTQKTYQAERKAFMFRILLNIASFIGLTASVFMLFNAILEGDISVGAFAAVFASLTQLFSIMDEIVSRHLSGGSEQLGQLRNYYHLMDMEEVGGENGVPDFTKGIVANGVSFTYPGRDEPAIKEMMLRIKNQETIAIVGENGAGKSTLVRLLMGIYLPDDGEVRIGDLDSKKTHPRVLFGSISGVFQCYQRYKMTLAENVAISDTTTPPNIENISKSLSASEFNEDVATLDTMLSPEFDGIDLSGGQWQRLAIARGFYRTNNFIVLDEPTSAIDPIEEERVYNHFKRLSKNKCAIIVTHRLGSAKLADRIIVMENGKITDIGTHKELIDRKGKYADMWKSQMAWYDNRM